MSKLIIGSVWKTKKIEEDRDGDEVIHHHRPERASKSFWLDSNIQLSE